MSVDSFLSDEYQRHNRRRQEHLASLGLDFAGLSVVEIGAGIGDHTSFFLDRGCRVTVTDARADNLAWVAKRYPTIKICLFDADESVPENLFGHDVVYAYGVLYHLRDPAKGLRAMAQLCAKILLLETCVSYGIDSSINPINENLGDATQAVGGVGCRPTRRWVFEELRQLFPYVYVTRTQPWHEEFPVNWAEKPTSKSTLVRSVFVAAREPLNNPQLSDRLIDEQRRH